MNIILIYQYFLSDDEPGHTRWNEMVKNWSKSGHKVTIISGMINYSTGKEIQNMVKKYSLKKNTMKMLM